MESKRRRVGPRYIISFAGFFVVLTSLIVLGYLEMNGHIHYGLYFLGFIPVFIFFQMFMHDVIHYSAHPNRAVNEFVGWIGSFIAGAPLYVLRYTHLAHHRYANTDKDPDYWLYHLKWYQVWIFLFLGFVYTPHIRKLNLKKQVICVAHILVCLAIWIAFPYQSFKYWVIPGLVSGFFFGFVFIYAAHSSYWSDKKYLFGPLAIGHDHHHVNQAPSLWNWIIDGKVLGME